MIDKKQKKILILALYAGEVMMQSGAEIYRVEDTITRICRACKIPFVECFATTTGIFLSLDRGEEDGDMYTFIKRIHHTSIDLGKISKVNSFSRDFTTTDLSVEDGFELLKEIDDIPIYNFFTRLFGAILVSSFFCLMFQGTPLDCLCALCISIPTYILSKGIEKLQLNRFISIFLSCAVVAFLALLCLQIGIGQTLSSIIVGGITMFLPGTALTNAARDLLSGDMLSGIARATEAFITAIAIAGGVFVILKLSYMIGGVL